MNVLQHVSRGPRFCSKPESQILISFFLAFNKHDHPNHPKQFLFIFGTAQQPRLGLSELPRGPRLGGPWRDGQPLRQQSGGGSAAALQDGAQGPGPAALGALDWCPGKLVEQIW